MKSINQLLLDGTISNTWRKVIGKESYFGTLYEDCNKNTIAVRNAERLPDVIVISEVIETKE